MTSALPAAAAESTGALTPIDWQFGIGYKRDDLYRPYPDIPLSGGKVRQAQRLLEPRAEQIKAEHDGWVLTATSVHSPQGVIIARVAHEFGLRTRLFVGATTWRSAVTKHSMLRWALLYSCDLDCSSGAAFSAPLLAAMRRHQAQVGGFLVRFGINMDDDPDAILGSTAAQAANIPAEVRTVVIPTGSAITAAGLIPALPDSVERIIVIQIAGADRSEVIRARTDRPFEYHADPTHPYARQLQRRVGPITLDPIYEAKAHDFMLRWCRPARDGSWLFWLIGDSTDIRRPL
jgi:1-aminocyclopropane-1-carboxylate deaminase/D-cysteine desulfhydrase-like pyridoxal-dependent ACC family enzyme